MPLATHPEWQQIALYALGGAVLLTLLFSIPKVGAVIRGVFSIALLAFGLFVVLQQAPFDPNLSRLMTRAGLDSQQVVGEEVRIRMASNGHFWAEVELNGVRRRMLVDSGATVTALSEATARAAGVTANADLFPVVLRTANGAVTARTGKVERLTLGGIEARDLKVVVSPALGSMDVLGMNFLSQLGSWRVEGRTLVLTPATSTENAVP